MKIVKIKLSVNICESIEIRVSDCIFFKFIDIFIGLYSCYYFFF